MALFRSNINQGGIRYGAVVDLDPTNPSVMARVASGVLTAVDAPSEPPAPVEAATEAPEVTEAAPPAKAPAKKRAAGGRKKRIADAVESGDLVAAQTEVLAEVDDVFADLDGANPEPAVEVEGDPAPEVEGDASPSEGDAEGDDA